MKIVTFKKVWRQIPNLLFRNRFKFKFELLPFEAQGITWKKKWNFFIAALNQFFLPGRPLGYPVIAQVEPANYCNLDCPLCLTVSQTSARPSALLSFELFKKFIDECGDYLLLIVMWNWGEPFLNPDIIKMISYATSKNILVHCSTNGNVMFDEETAGKIVDSGLSSLIFGVDGATAETYRTYRNGGDLERVKENIRTLLQAKKRKASSTPLVNLRFVAMQHNEKELPLMKQMAIELGVDFFSIKSVDLPGGRGENLDYHYRPQNKNYRRYDYENNSYTRVKKKFICMRPWKRLTLDALGQVISCEYDYKNQHPFGHLGDGYSPMEAWKSQSAKEFRRQFHKGHNDFYHCKTCTYKDLRTEECTVEAYRIGVDLK